VSRRASLAVVVPVLDEAANLRVLLPALRPLADEVVVADGSSADGSAQVARELGARVVTGPPGRGGQLNRGAAATTADILLFLHADTRLPPEAPDLVRRALAAGAPGGGFLVRFDDRRWSFRVGERLVNLRTRLTRVPLGDQAQFAHRDAFSALGGYPDWPILEDLEFGRRLKRLGRPALLAPPVTTAARRYVRGGILSTVGRNWLIWGLYACGVDPRRLAGLYGRGR
jgi:rSAM/selenodomain-associated transferase 2